VLCRPYSAGILQSVSDQMQNLQNYFTTPNKMTSENDIKGLVSLKFLRPWGRVCSVEDQISNWLWLSTFVFCLLIYKTTNREKGEYGEGVRMASCL
jgi:hypothetical protein